MTVRWVRHGAVTSTTVSVVARVDGDESINLLMSESEDLSDPAIVPGVLDEHGVARFTLDDLDPETTYHYAVDVGSGPVLPGTFRTFPHPGTPTSFTLVHGSCNTTGSNGLIWDHLRSLDPDLFVHLGDFHYRDIATADLGEFIDAYDTVLSSARRPAQAFRELAAVARVWDDHDYGPNNSDSTSPSRQAAIDSFRLLEPHYPLPDDEAIYQSFVYGRVRFVLLDCRTHRSPVNATDNESKSQLGADQLAWLFGELAAAKASGHLVMLCSSVVWIGNHTGPDGWWAYATERQAIIDAITELGVDVVVLCGDVHAVMIDNGSNSPGGLPMFCAAPFNQFATVGVLGTSAGGPYSHGGLFLSGAPGQQIQQYGHTAITDDGTTIRLVWEGRSVDPSTGDHTVMVRHKLAFRPGLPHLSTAAVVSTAGGWGPA